MPSSGTPIHPPRDTVLAQVTHASRFVCKPSHAAFILEMTAGAEGVANNSTNNKTHHPDQLLDLVHGAAADVAHAQDVHEATAAGRVRVLRRQHLAGNMSPVSGCAERAGTMRCTRPWRCTS